MAVRCSAAPCIFSRPGSLCLGVPCASRTDLRGSLTGRKRSAEILAGLPSAPRRARDDCLQELRTRLPDIVAAAAQEDHDGAFPVESLAHLREAGLLTAPLATELGGLGWGSEPEGAASLATALRLIGRASLPLGRLYEGHVNALRLVQSYGGPAQIRSAACDAQNGLFFGVWNTEARGEPPLTLRSDGRLEGRKILCSGAGYVARALVTARDAAQPQSPPRMLLVALAPGQHADLSGWTAQGMRASATGAMDFTGIAADAAVILGAPGDYTRQPDFSAGAWRFAAVHCGGAEAVLGALRAHLRTTGRGGDPHQAARLGCATMATAAARLWVEKAAELAEAARAETTDGGDATVAFVNLARLAVERAALDVIELAQRSVGLTAFLRPNPLERITRDLATYLRQPMPDRALTEAAAYVLQAFPEPGDLWN